MLDAAIHILDVIKAVSKISNQPLRTPVSVSNQQELLLYIAQMWPDMQIFHTHIIERDICSTFYAKFKTLYNKYVKIAEKYRQHTMQTPFKTYNTLDKT